jgi:PAS domain S-box-containing protein
MDFVSMDATPPSRDELAQRLAVTYEHATVGIAEIDAEGRRMNVNATACTITGRAREELLGGNVFDVIHPEDRDEDVRQYQRLIAGEIDRYSVEKRIVRKDGSVIWASVMCSGVRDGAGKFLYAVRIFQDITEARQASEALAESEQRLAATYEHAGIAISEVDAQGRLLRVNETTCAITGYSREELLGLTVFDVTHPDDRESDLDSFERQTVDADRRYAVEKRLVRKDGRIIWVAVTSSTVRDSAGRFCYGIRVMRHISERKQAEANQKMLLDELNHRVKNNMQMLHALLRAAERETQSAEARAVLADAGQRVGAMAAAQQMLYEAGSPLTYRARDFLQGVCAGASQAFTRNIKIAIAQCAPEQLSNDTAMPLALILNELLTNAAKYGSNGRNEGSITVQLTKGVDSFELTVEDDGPGFDLGEAHRRSSGLGLVSGLARQLGGALTVERVPGARCRVHFVDRGLPH